MWIMQASSPRSRGHGVSLSNTKRRGVVVNMRGEQHMFRLIERTKNVPTGKDYPRYLVETGLTGS
jgi:hypothetical protein